MNRNLKNWMILFVLLLSASGLRAKTVQGKPLDIRVEGKNLVDSEKKVVRLHGVMDTPNRYFNNWLWQSWKENYSDEDVPPCLEYFEKMFTAITDKAQGSYCNVFRLHMDPCWTNDPTKKSEGEADISAFQIARYKHYLQELYIPLIKAALGHGLYVIVRPPGVCPQDINVGDKYNRYLKSVWKNFAADPFIQEHAGVVSIELANEPVRVHLADGKDSESALHDYFQPVVDEIRTAGFKGIVWVPGAGYQSQYQNYVKYPITDSENNFSYAVHVYSGWYGASDSNCNHDAFISQFKTQVPVVETKPIMVTEVDWSPEDPDRESEGHYNEWGQWTQPNLGSWATASTSKWGLAWKAVHDHFGNIGMTITHPNEYYDIETYLKSGKLQPGFQNAKKHGLFEECCGDACFKWYKEWWLQDHPTTGIGSIVDSTPIVATYYYDLQGRTVNKPQNGVYIVKQVLKGGKTISRKECHH